MRLSDIYYCEVINRKLFVHTRNEVIAYYGRIKEAEQQTAPDFIRCHRSFLVNPGHLSEYRDGSAVLENGERIPVSKGCHGIFMKKMMEYMEGQHGMAE